MRVIAHVLCKVDNHRLVMEQMSESEAITDIVRAYDQIATRSLDHLDPDKHMCLVGIETYGSDFKQWLSNLPPSDKWRLLDRYLCHFPKHAEGDAQHEREGDGGRPGRETEEQKDKRTRKHWFLMLCMIMMFFIMVLVVAAGVAVMSTKHLLPDNAIVKAIFETATELAKILFTLK